MAETKKKAAPKKVASKGTVTFEYNNDKFEAKLEGETPRDVAVAIVGMGLALPKSKVLVTVKTGKKEVSKTYFRPQALKFWSTLSTIEINLGLLMKGM